MIALILGTDATRSGFAKGHATGLQTSEEIADLFVFLASAAARSLTGAVLNCVRGGTLFNQPDVIRG
jgi:NAD(P)-dependent dehydrogenase (short-subunit alcohol dehydrogenase family)